MKTKRIFAFLLCLVLALSLLPWEAVPVRAADEGTEENPYLVDDWDDLATCLSDGGYIRLRRSVKWSEGDTTLYVSDNVTAHLDLNGCTIDYNHAESESSDPVIGVDGTLTLTDSRGGGKLTGGNNQDSGGGVWVSGGSFTMTGGTITGNKAGDDGGGVCVSDGGSFTMTGGTITGNEAEFGGGVAVFLSSSFTMTGGTVSDEVIVSVSGELLKLGGTLASDDVEFDSTHNPTVTFYKNDGTETTETQTISGGKGTLRTMSDLFDRDGFTGWNTEPDGSGLAIQDGAEVILNVNLTLYAQPKTEAAKPKLTITAKDKTLDYTGQPQGEGDTVYDDPTKIARRVTVDGLLDGDTLNNITIESQGTEIGTYPIEVSNAKIFRTVDGKSVDVTGEYDIKYVPGTLTIREPATISAGSGTEDDPYQITNYDELRAFARIVNTRTENAAFYGKLMNPINASASADAEDWTPIGSSSASYKGTFDGNGFAVTGLTYDNAQASYAGLFGVSYGTVQNVTLEGGSITGRDEVGGIVGYNNGTVENCRNASPVSGTGSSVGGVAGWNEGTVERCANTGSVTGTGASANVGGVAGDNYGSVARCSNTGSVTGKNYVGGVVGYNDRSVSKVFCAYNTGEVSGAAYAGGVVGCNQGTVSCVYNVGDVSGSVGAGGVIGANTGEASYGYFDNVQVTYTNPVGEAPGPAYKFAIGGQRDTDTVKGLSTDQMTGEAAKDGMKGFDFIKDWLTTDSYPVLRVPGAKPKLTITVKDQTYTYNGQPQGEGDPAYDDPGEIDKKVAVSGLLEGDQYGDQLVSIVLTGQGTEPGTYPIEANSAKIERTVGGKTADVTDDYDITYVDGTLIIEREVVPAIQLVENGTAEKIQGKQESNVYFGNYPQSSADSKDPIKWRVLSNASGKLFLLSDQNLDAGSGREYHEDYAGVTWARSTIRAWLNGYDASAHDGSSGKDYTNDSFIGTAFAAKEQAALADTSLTNENNPNYGTSGGADTTDKVFFLSISEASNGDYGFNTIYDDTDPARAATDTAYAASKGTYGGYWWLRSPGDHDGLAAFVYADGFVNDYGYLVNDNYVAVRPAFHLNLNSVLFTSAAAGGKDGETGTLAAIGDYSGSDWKLTLLDWDRKSFFVTETSATAAPGGTVVLNYTDAKTGTNEYVSAILRDDSGALLYYGRLAQPANADGTVTVTVPDGLADGTYTLLVFSEQYNGDKKTDYASVFSNVALTVAAAPTTYTVAITSGEHMTLAETSGAVSQSVTVGSGMTDVVYTAAEGYHFPATNTAAINKTNVDAGGSLNGVTVALNDDGTELTISGTPTENVGIQLEPAAANTYTVSFDGSGATSGSMTAQNFTYDAEQALSKNGFGRAFTVTYAFGGATGGNPAASDTATAAFGGWALKAGGDKEYEDEQKVKNLTAVDGDTVTLYALWTDGSVTLPSPEKTGSTFEGWYSDEAFKTSIGGVGATYTPEGDCTIYAKWSQNGVAVADLTDTTYNGAEQAPQLTVTDAVTKQALSESDYTVTYVTADGTSVDVPKDAGEYTVTVAGAGAYEAAEAVEKTYTINKAAVTITAASKTFTYNGEAQSDAGYTVEGLFGEDAIEAVVSGSITFPGESQVDNVVESYKFTSGKESNYFVTTVNGKLTMNTASAQITITAGSGEWTYDGAAHENTEVTITEGSLFTGDELVASATGSVTNVTDDGNNPVDADIKIMHGDEDVTANYGITPVAGTLTINPAEASIEAENKSKVYNTDDPELTAIVTGAVKDEELNYELSRETGENVGEYKITVTPGENPNSAVTTADGTFTITEAKITITAKDQTVKYRNPMPKWDESSYTVTGLPKGVSLDTAPSVRYLLNGREVAVDTEVVGTYEIVPYGASAANYEITYVSGKLVIEYDRDDYGFSPEIDQTPGGTVEVNPNSPLPGDTVKVTLTPDPGYQVGTVTVTDSHGDEVLVEKDGDVYTFTQPDNIVTIHVEFVPINPFTDVKETDYFYDAVLWAWRNGIAAGTTKTTYGPDDDCSRGQMVAFLWRAAGSPEPKGTKSPFTDVKATDYYYQAVLWAYENGIAYGDGSGKFDPNGTVTRGQMVAFLWRAAGSPEPKRTTNPFTDVKATDYYYKAVLWAYENGIAYGTGNGKFSPDEPCKRGQMAAFLYRAYGKE